MHWKKSRIIFQSQWSERCFGSWYSNCWEPLSTCFDLLDFSVGMDYEGGGWHRGSGSPDHAWGSHRRYVWHTFRGRRGWHRDRLLFNLITWEWALTVFWALSIQLRERNYIYFSFKGNNGYWISLIIYFIFWDILVVNE